jgi:hypothetical protein
MDHPGVPTGLVLGDLGFLFQDGHAVAAPTQFVRSREPHDSGSGDDDVLAHGAFPSGIR